MAKPPTMQEVMDRPHVCLCGHKSEAKLKELSFTEEVNTSGNLHWMLGCVGLPRWHVHYRSRTTFVYFFASDLYPACLCCGKEFGEERQEGSHQVVGKPLADSKPQCSRVQSVMSWKTHFFCSHSASSFATAVLPSKWPGVLQGKGDCRKYAGTAYGSCCLRPSMVFPSTFSTGLLLPQPSVVSTNLKGTAWEPRRHVDKDFFSRG